MATKVEKPAVTIDLEMVVARHCPHCGTETVQVGDLPDGWSEEDHSKGKQSIGHCLQCIADGGTCCTLEDFNRWPDEEQ